MKYPDPQATFLEACPDPVVILTGEEIAYANDAACNLVELPSPDAVVGRNVLELVVPDERDDVRTTLQRILAGGAETNRIHRRIETATGETRHIEATGRRITWDDQPAILVIVRDVTEQVTRENQLTALHDATRTFIQATTPTDVAEQAIDAARDILGHGFTSIHRYDSEEDALAVVTATEGLHDEVDTSTTFERGEGIAWRVFEAGDPTLVTDTHEDPDVYNPDTPFRTELYLPLGDYGLMIVAAHDPDAISEPDRQLLEIVAANTEVAIKEVTYRRRLEDREETLKAQNEQLEDFASIVSHDLRNPLTTATGYVDLVKETGDLSYLDQVEDAHERMIAIIEDIRFLTHRTDDPLGSEAISLTDAIEDAWTTVPSPESDASLATSNDLGTIRADESYLRQLLENLFRNALDHAGDDVTVTVTSLPDGFAVCDDGPGLPPEDRESIFEKGFSTSDRGTGLGLYIVSQIADAYDWGITVTESDHGGACFEFHGVVCD